MNVLLSKSRIQSGRQCRKRLWLELNEPDAAVWEGPARSRFDGGTLFGQLARELLGAGTLVGADHLHGREALAETAALLSRPIEETPLLFEAAFVHDDVLVRIDVLQRHADSDTLIEVKSTTDKKPEHLWDSAIQTWVARGAGRTISTIMIGHVDNQFVYASLGEYGGLLKLVDVTDAVNALVPSVAAIVTELGAGATGAMPEISTGGHCNKPYACPFIAYCKASEPAEAEFPIRLLPGGNAIQKFLVDAGHRDLRDVPVAELKSEKQLRVVEATRSGQTFVSSIMWALLEAIPYPRFYLDFETIQFAVPRWLGTRPYQQLPFQFSCHIEASAGQLRHESFLDVSGASPLAEFTERLLEVLRENGPILVWNMSFEKGRLKDLALALPQHAAALNAVIDRMIDLLPIYREHYYHRDMRGSWSIKAVLPTLAPDLDYGDLDVAGGTAAQEAYLQAIHPETSAGDRAAIERNLLAYCERDTLAMTRLMRPA